MDLATILPGERTKEILHPGTQQPLGIIVSFCSLDDERMKKVRKKIANDLAVLQRRGKNFNADQIEANTNLTLFTAMTGWSWNGVTVVDQPERTEMQSVIIPASDDQPERTEVRSVVVPAVTHFEPSLFNGDKPTFTQENVYRVFTALPWFRDQIAEEVGESASFFQT